MDDFTRLFIILCWVVVFAYIGINAFKTKRTVTSHSFMLRIVLFVIVFIAFVLAVYFFPSFRIYYASSIKPPAPMIGVVADIITFAGAVIIIWARKVLGLNWSPFAVIKENHELIKTGPYKYVRHPMYSGLLLLFIGAAVWFWHIAGLVFLCVSIFVFWIKAKQEEKLLMEHFTEDYSDYKKHTKALIPFLW